MTIATAKSRLLADAKVKTSTETALAAQSAYVAELDKLLPVMSTAREAEALRQVIKTEKDATLLAKAGAALDALQTDGAKKAAERARQLATGHLTVFAAAVKSLLAVAATAADALVLAARADEQAFQKSWGLGSSTDGAVVQSAIDVKRAVGHQVEMLNRETNGVGPLPIIPRRNTLGTIISFFRP